jgi:hypothetical protein
MTFQSHDAPLMLLNLKMTILSILLHGVLARQLFLAKLNQGDFIFRVPIYSR